MNTDKNKPELKQKSLLSGIHKSRAINLRLSAFICGLKFYNTRQPTFIIVIKYVLCGLLLVIDKLQAINLRLSVFICGLKFYNTRQLYVISNKGQLAVLYDIANRTFVYIHLRLTKFHI
ncbi:Uncharacterised protein [uncultured archaeon]|nr:Uncharacterised protein [uncultured archaeon]